MLEEGKVNAEIEEMLNALGSPSSTDSEDDEGETDEEKAAKELKESEDVKLSEDEKAAEAELLAEKEKRKNETEEEREEREAKEAEEYEKKEIDALAKLNAEREDRKKAEEDARIKAEEDAKKLEPLKLEDQDFIGDLDLDELLSDKGVLNKLLNTVYSKGVNDSNKLAIEKLLNSVPDIVKQNLDSIVTMKEMSDKFYKENENLVPFKKVVAAVFEDIASANPDKKYSELMNLVAPEARKRLGLPNQAVNDEKGNGDGKGKPPRLHGAKNNQRQTLSQKTNPSALESEISEMNKVLGR